MLRCRGQFTFCHWLAVSLVLHAGIIALALIFTGLHIPDQHRHNHNKLVIELFGMVADRQQEERRGGDPGKKAIPQRPVMPQPRIASPGRPAADVHKTVEADTPVHVDKAEDKAKQTGKATDEEAPQSTQVSTASLPVVYQRQQSIGYDRDQDADKTKAYLAKVAKRLRANLVYPEEVRKLGIEGVSVVAFTIMESGGIKDNSLRVQKSSGYAALDSNALKSVGVSAPFEKPPKELDVSIAVSFTVEMARSRRNQGSLR
jgi:protein TonB